MQALNQFVVDTNICQIETLQGTLICYVVIVYMYRISCAPGENVVFDHVVFSFAGTSVPKKKKKTCLGLLLISYDNIFKKKE